MCHIRLFLLLIAGACAAALNADIPAGYYADLDGKSDAELKYACYLTVRDLTRVSSYSALPKYFQYTDVYPNSDRWWDMYSDIELYAPTFSGLNREHSFPKSWWGGDESVNAYVDLFHLYPSEMQANLAKSNYPLGTVDRSAYVKFDNGVSTVGYPVAGQGGGCTYVYEPDDQYKGDFARTYFYMVTCYQDLTWNTRYMYMLQQNAYPTLKSWAIDLLLKWSRDDPVSQKELDRNEAVYGFQNNRNPFIDFPMLAEYIWGSRRDDIFYLADQSASAFPISSDTTEETLAVTALPGAVRFICSSPHTDVRIYDTTGRLVITASSVEDNTIIALPAGFYIITSYQTRTPRKVSVR